MFQPGASQRHSSLDRDVAVMKKVGQIGSRWHSRMAAMQCQDTLTSAISYFYYVHACICYHYMTTHVIPVLQGKANMACDLNAVGTKLCGALVS